MKKKSGKPKVRKKGEERKPDEIKEISIDKVKKKFSTYEEKIDKLKSLERELNVLNPTEFPVEERIIKSKLKDPTEIPKIERMIDNLERKMIKKSERKPTREKFTPIIRKTASVDGDLQWVRNAIQKGWKRESILVFLRRNNVDESRIRKLIGLYDGEMR